jgi:hypothetical protein
MSRHRLRAGLAVAGLAVAGLAAAGIAGCGSRPAPSAQAAPPVAPPLVTTFASGAGTGWAIVEMGGSAADENNFWELFARQPGSATWRLATPLGVADNGGLVVTGTGANSLTTGFVPSQDLTFSPLATSADGGAKWTSGSPVNPGLAAMPDALASGPGDDLIALTSQGAKLSQNLGASWRSLASAKTLGATPSGRACAVTGLTAVALASWAGSPGTDPGTPMLGAGCGRPGVTGIFAETAGAWHAAGPPRLALPGSLAREDIQVVRLAATSAGVTALLRAGTGPDAALVAAWTPAGATAWKVSPPLRLGSRRLLSTTVGPGWAVGVTLSGGRGETLTGPDASAWRSLPALPKWAAALSLGSSGEVDAIAAHAGTFQDYRLGVAGWGLAQTLRVTIPYGSSG